MLKELYHPSTALFVRGKSFVLNTWNGEHFLNINICYNTYSTFVCVSGGGLLSGGLFAQGVNVRGAIVRGAIVRGVNVQVVNVRGLLSGGLMSAHRSNMPEEIICVC